MNPGTILLVEDNPDDVALATRALRRSNIKNDLVVAGDGEEALRHILPADADADADDAGAYAGNGRPGDAGHGLPVLVLLDINLPKVNGLDVLRAIRSNERTKYLPVVVLTTSSEERDIVESYQLGANSYVRKPIIFEDFLEAVKILGLYWLLVNQPAAVPLGKPNDHP
jgi:two-component system response regulator